MKLLLLKMELRIFEIYIHGRLENLLKSEKHVFKSLYIKYLEWKSNGKEYVFNWEVYFHIFEETPQRI